MPVAVAVAAANTSTGTQDITTSDLGGLTPKAALFIYSRSTTDGEVADDFGSSFGVTDGTTQFALASYVKDGEPWLAGVVGDTAKTTKCVCALYNDGTTQVHSEAEFSAFITNGVRINWTTMEVADGWLLTVVLFAGSDWAVKAGIEPIVLDAEVNVGFEPNCILFFGRANGLPPDDEGFGGSIHTNRARYSIGGIGWSPTVGSSAAYQHGWTWGIATQEFLISGADQEAPGTLAPDPAVGYQFEPGGQYNFSAQRSATGYIFKNFGGLGFPHHWGYLALQWTGGRVYCDYITTAASTGDQSFTGIPFTPQGLLLFPSVLISNSVGLLGRRGGVVMMTETKSGGFSGTSRHDGVAGVHIDKTVSCEDTVRMIDQTDASAAAASLASFDPEGFTLNFTVAPAAGWLWPFLAFGPDSGGGTTTRNQAWIID